MAALERQAIQEALAAREAIETRQLARNRPPDDLGYGRHRGSASRLPSDDPEDTGIVAEFDQANRRFWQANTLSEREYRQARTDEEAHAALYN